MTRKHNRYADKSKNEIRVNGETFRRSPLMKNIYSFTKMKNYRILFERNDHSGKIGWTTIEDCKDAVEAIEYFQKHFPEQEIIQVREIAD